MNEAPRRCRTPAAAVRCAQGDLGKDVKGHCERRIGETTCRYTSVVLAALVVGTLVGTLVGIVWLSISMRSEPQRKIHRARALRTPRSGLNSREECGMQGSYVGDVGDFVKYGLLRAISEGKRLGCVVPAARSRDGLPSAAREVATARPRPIRCPEEAGQQPRPVD